jgi:pilus assembly protein TadC
VLPALFLALATGVLLSTPVAPGRLAVLLPRPEPPASVGLPGGPSARARALACAVAGGAAWLLVGGPAGLAVGATVAAVGPRLLGRLPADGEEQEVAAALPLALELLAACLAGGAVPADAVRAVAAAVPGACGARLARVAAALTVGSVPSEAWRALGDDRGPAGAAARALARAAEGGAPVAAAVLRVAEQARHEQAGRAERAARRAGVLAVGPLGLCFLPAFLLIGVVPAVVGLAAPLLASF